MVFDNGGKDTMTNEQICILLLSLSIFALLQMNVWNIGNRQYSMHFESTHLIKRKGIFKLIYYKPKHFHRYSIWEVISFFLDIGANVGTKSKPRRCFSE